LQISLPTNPNFEEASQCRKIKFIQVGDEDLVTHKKKSKNPDLDWGNKLRKILGKILQK
jgi:hypothetical protein